MHLIAYSEGLSPPHIEFFIAFDTIELPLKALAQMSCNNDLDLLKLALFRSLHLQFNYLLQVSISNYPRLIKAA